MGARPPSHVDAAVVPEVRAITDTGPSGPVAVPEGDDGLSRRLAAAAPSASA